MVKGHSIAVRQGSGVICLGWKTLDWIWVLTVSHWGYLTGDFELHFFRLFFLSFTSLCSKCTWVCSDSCGSLDSTCSHGSHGFHLWLTFFTDFLWFCIANLTAEYSSEESGDSLCCFLDSAFSQVTALGTDSYILQLRHPFIWAITVKMDEILVLHKYLFLMWCLLFG